MPPAWQQLPAVKLLLLLSIALLLLLLRNDTPSSESLAELGGVPLSARLVLLLGVRLEVLSLLHLL